MNPHLYPTSSLLFMFMISIFIHVPRSLCVDDKQYVSCGQLFQCGNITNIGYPFWGGNRPDYCGHPGFRLNCRNDVPLLSIGLREHRMLAIDNGTQRITVVREDYVNDICPRYLYNSTLDTTLFSYTSDTQNVTLFYSCPSFPSIPGQPSLPILFNCNVNNSASVGYYDLRPTINLCNTSITVQVFQPAFEALGSSPPSIRIGEALNGGFGLQWLANNSICDECSQSGGRCGYDSGTFTCFCPQQPHALRCNTTTQNGNGNVGVRKNVPLTIGLAILGAAVFGIGLGWCIFSCKQRRKRLAAQSAQSAQTVSKDLPTPPSSKGFSLATPQTNFSGSIPSYPSFSSKNSDLEKGSTYFGVQVFSYAELEEATDNFNTSRELGEGGFGTVYFGKLHDDRIVAVKRLYENNFKRVEQFMNEVEILTRLRHQNLVTLYGCTSRRSRELLLVYEYIPNGTVADHLHGKRANSGLLSWPVRLSIAIETASALAYLHASDIIHRDVKTNNILLDNDFHVKVADFGLSRLFPTDATHVSTAPQGTPGYVDPEYYQCYQLTDKSDVYSFGVVLIELISSKQAVDTNRHRHDINLANMAVNKIQNHTLHELVDLSLGFETNNSVRRMTTLVGELAFRCLQQEKDMRPSMEEVLNALKGIENEELSVQKPEVLDIMEDDVRLLKVKPPQLSPDSAVTEKWVSCSTTPNSSG